MAFPVKLDIKMSIDIMKRALEQNYNMLVLLASDMDFVPVLSHLLDLKV